ncbi:hypothetical protein C8R47DRAFT_1153944 [Mycena vitilis]|nr:hypothetical protein C8R47DRAFT_1153944 [Mycena vitilis]
MPPTNPGTQRATKQERALLIFTLLNPLHEDACCVLSLRGILDKVLSKKKPEDDSRQGEILRAAMTFLCTINRSDEEHTAIRERLETCHCKPAIRIFHRPVCRPHTEVLEMVLFIICTTIMQYFLRLGPGKFRKPKANVAPEAQPWPSSITDIIPYPGAEHAVLCALVQWASTIPGGHSVFALIGALARFWDPFAAILFQCPGVFLLATRHMRRALDVYDPRAPQAVLMHDFISPILACAQGLFLELSQVEATAIIKITAGLYPEMAAIAGRIDPILLSLRGQIEDDCRRWFHMVRDMSKLVAPDGTFIERSDAEVMLNMTPQSHFIGAFDRMVEIRNRNQCQHIECMTPVLGRSSVCSRCGIVRFCTRQCLESAWAAPTLPHKTLCKHIQRLRAAAHLCDEAVWTNLVRDDNVFHRSPLKFLKACDAGGVDPQLAQAVWTGITRLAKEKNNFLVRVEQAAAAAAAQAVEEEDEEDLEDSDAGERWEDSVGAAEEEMVLTTGLPLGRLLIEP